MLTKQLMSEYRRFRKSGMQASDAMQAARTEIQWERLASAGFVALNAVADPDYDWSDKAERERYGDDGAWGVCGWYTTEPERCEDVEPSFTRGCPWTAGDAVWGHVGYRNPLDPAENWNAVYIKAATIDELATALKSRCPRCHRATA